MVKTLDVSQLFIGKHGGGQEQLPAVFVIFHEQIALASDGRLQRHDQRLADGINGRVGHLGKNLLEIVVQ